MSPANWLSRVFNLRTRLAAAELRWVVLDCESSGLDAQRDRLLAIGAVAVEGGRIPIDDSFSVLLRQDAASDASNIVIHGITGTEQLSGTDPGEALGRFAQFAADAPLVAFHAPFDRALLTRALRQHGRALDNRWLDLATLAPALYPQHARRCKALDDWLGLFGIANPRRHDALSDAYATAMLFQMLLECARTQGAHTDADLLRVAHGRHWLAATR